MPKHDNKEPVTFPELLTSSISQSIGKALDREEHHHAAGVFAADREERGK